MANEREVRKEKDFWGNEKEVVYEDGRKVGEIREEQRGGFLGMGAESVKVEYDNSGRETSYTKQEERGGFLGIGAEPTEVRYDSSGSEIGHSRVEERGGFLGMGSHHVRVEYDNTNNEISQTNYENRGGFLGLGQERVRVTKYSPGARGRSDGPRNETSSGGSSSYVGAGFSSSTNSSGSSAFMVVVVLIAVIFGIIKIWPDNERTVVRPAVQAPKIEVYRPVSQSVNPAREMNKQPFKSPVGRYMDGAGCMREPTGRAVPGFKPNCY